MIFIDSSAFIAYYNKRDQHHEKAVKIFKKISAGDFGRPITSDYIWRDKNCEGQDI